MAETTTAVNACDVSIWMDKAAGTLVDISGSSNKVSLNLGNKLGEYKVYKQKWMKRLECGKDAEVKLVIVYTEATDEAIDILKNWFFADPPGNRTFKIYIPDKNVGADVYAGEFKIEALEIPTDTGEAGPVMVTATLKPDGAVTLTTNAT